MPDDEQDQNTQDPKQDAPDAAASDEPRVPIPPEDWIPHPQGDWVEDRPLPAYEGKTFDPQTALGLRPKEPGETPERGKPSPEKSPEK